MLAYIIFVKKKKKILLRLITANCISSVWLDSWFEEIKLFNSRCCE